MKRLLLILALATLPALAQTAPTLTAVPSATPHSATPTWTLDASSCNATTPCIIAVYRYSGQCSSANFSTASWQIVNPVTSSESQQNITSYKDTSVASGDTYCYAVKASYASGNTSGPSNTWQAVIPKNPAPPAAVTGSAQ